MPSDSTTVTAPSPTTRSRLTNGRDLFLGDVDGRSREARRYRDVYAALIAHLGGEDHASEVKRHLAKRASALIVWAEVEEAKLATGEELDVQTYTTAVNALRTEKYRDRPSPVVGVPDDGPVFFKVTVPVMSDKLAGHTRCRAEIVPPRPSLSR